jgi:hypothetical protein
VLERISQRIGLSYLGGVIFLESIPPVTRTHYPGRFYETAGVLGGGLGGLEGVSGIEKNATVGEIERGRVKWLVCRW